MTNENETYYRWVPDSYYARFASIPTACWMRPKAASPFSARLYRVEDKFEQEVLIPHDYPSTEQLVTATAKACHAVLQHLIDSVQLYADWSRRVAMGDYLSTERILESYPLSEIHQMHHIITMLWCTFLATMRHQERVTVAEMAADAASAVDQIRPGLIDEIAEEVFPFLDASSPKGD